MAAFRTVRKKALLFGLAPMLAGVVVVLITGWIHMEMATEPPQLYVILFGLGLFVAGQGYSYVFYRCPACSARIAVPSAKWGGYAFTFTTDEQHCPSCGVKLQ